VTRITPTGEQICRGILAHTTGVNWSPYDFVHQYFLPVLESAGLRRVRFHLPRLLYDLSEEEAQRCRALGDGVGAARR